MEIADFASASTDAVVVCDPSGIVLHWNAGAEVMYGREASTTVGRSLSDFALDQGAHGRDWAVLKRTGFWTGQVGRINATGDAVVSEGRRLLRRRADGSLRDIVEISRLSEGTLQGTISDLRRIASRNNELIRHMPAALVQVDHRFADTAMDALRGQGVTDLGQHLAAHPELVEIAKQNVFVHDANIAAVKLFRASDIADLIGPVAYLFTATPELANRVMVNHFNGSRNYSEEAKILTFDGQLRDVSFSVTYPLKGELQETTFIMITDITEQRMTEGKLRQLQQEYSHAARISTLGELATSIAHEIKQPLSAIITNAEANLRWLKRADVNIDKVVQLTGRIIESADRANDIIQRIRDMAAKHVPERSAVDLRTLIDESVVFVRHDAEARSIELTTRLGDGASQVHGDRVLLQQVLVNLLVNAIQSVSDRELGKRRVMVTAELGAAGMISLHVDDTGAGIADDVIPRVFEGFFSTKQEGLGMGLAICQSLIESHGGTISAHNRDAGGASIRIELPMEADGSLEGRAVTIGRLAR